MKTHPSASLRPVPPAWAWHHRTLLRLRRQLLAAHATHHEEASAAVDLHGVDASEVAHDQTEHAEILAEMHAEEDRLGEIEDALARIQAGTYGTCEVTGQPIGAARLRAMPWTRTSLTAAERREREARMARGG